MKAVPMLLAILVLSHGTAFGQFPRELTSPNETAAGYFGFAVAGVGDLDGDDRDEVAVGAYGEYSSSGQPTGGRVYVFRGSDGSLMYDISSPGGREYGMFGMAVAGMDDITGDGVPDFLVGGPREGLGNIGQAHLFSGASGQRVSTLTSPDGQSTGQFGHSVSGAGDVDGDGVEDLLVSAHGEGPDTCAISGRVYLFSGATGLLLRTLVSPNPEQYGSFGFSVAGIGDVNGDGHGDVVVGAFQEAPGTSPAGAGRAYVFGGNDGSLIYTLVSPAEESSGMFGRCVAGPGDLDGDGFGDIVVGAHQEDPGDAPASAGRAHVFSGSDGRLLYTLVSAEEQISGLFAVSVAGAGDVDGDGVTDVVVGAYWERSASGVRRAGHAHIYSGSDGSFIRSLSSPNEEPYGYFGSAVAGAGDVDADGLGDVVVGAYQENPGASPTDAGRAFLFTGALPARQATLVGKLRVRGPFPNPVRSETHFALSLPEGARGPAILSLLDLSGRIVDEIRPSSQDGEAPVTWRPTDAGVAPGVYLLRATADGHSTQKHLVVLR